MRLAVILLRETKVFFPRISNVADFFSPLLHRVVVSHCGQAFSSSAKAVNPTNTRSVLAWFTPGIMVISPSLTIIGTVNI